MIQYSGYDNVKDILRPRRFTMKPRKFSWNDILELRTKYNSNSLWNFYLRDDLRDSELFKELTQ